MAISDSPWRSLPQARGHLHDDRHPKRKNITLSTVPDHLGRYAGSKHQVWQRLCHHGTGSNDCASADVRHDHGSAAHPRPFTDANHLLHSRLCANRLIQVRKAMALGSARNMDTCRQQDVVLQVNETKVAARSNVYISTDTRSSLGEKHTETNGRRWVAER